MDGDIDLSKNAEINEALKEFELKSTAEQAQKVQQEVSKNPETPKMVGLIMKISGGVIKDEKQAEYTLLGFAILAIAVSLFLVFSKTISQKPKIVPQFREDIELDVRAKLPPGVFENIPSKYDKK